MTFTCIKKEYERGKLFIEILKNKYRYLRGSSKLNELCSAFERIKYDPIRRDRHQMSPSKIKTSNMPDLTKEKRKMIEFAIMSLIL